MQTDALTLAAVADELTRMALGARVEDVIQPTPQSLAILLYGQGAKRWLAVSAHPQLARIHLTESRPRKLVNEPPAFVMLLRKHLEGARLTAIRQPRWERVIELAFARGGPESGMAPVWLTAELMGRQSNVILREDSAAGGEVLGALHTVPPGANRVRVLTPHVVYQPAPPQTRTLRGEQVPRLAPERATPALLETAALNMLVAAQEASSAEPPTGKRRGKTKRNVAPTVTALLMAHVAGCSREVAREVAYRTLGTTDAVLAPDLDWAALSAEMRSFAALMESRAWRPTLVYDASDAATPDAFAVYEAQQFPGATLRSMPSVNEALATYYQDAEWRVTVEGAKGELRRLLQTNRERCQRKAAALQGELGALEEARRLREEADLLLAFQSELPERATRAASASRRSLAAEDAGGDEECVRVTNRPSHDRTLARGLDRADRHAPGVRRAGDARRKVAVGVAEGGLESITCLEVAGGDRFHPKAEERMPGRRHEAMAGVEHHPDERHRVVRQHLDELAEAERAGRQPGEDGEPLVRCVRHRDRALGGLDEAGGHEAARAIGGRHRAQDRPPERAVATARPALASDRKRELAAIA
jgi:predicted ribosome quality control (RQC) complex YloA/Tae2 family protein